MLINSIIFNNYNLLNLINNWKLFILSTYKLIINYKYIKVKTNLFFINDLNKKLLKNILINKNNFNIKNLKLINIMIIKSFYVNIILKVKLFKFYYI